MFSGASSFDQCLLDTSFPGSATNAENMFSGTAGAVSVSDLSQCPSPAPTTAAPTTEQLTNGNIVEALDDWFNNPSAATVKYGHISFWDTGSVTNMDELFKTKTNFNDDISKWDVASVTTTT